MSLYTYVSSNPLGAIDPTGLINATTFPSDGGGGSKAVGIPGGGGGTGIGVGLGLGLGMAAAMNAQRDVPSDQVRNPEQSKRGEARCRCKAATNGEGGRGPSTQQWFYAERSGPTIAEAAREACRQANKHIGQAYPGCQGEHCHCVCSQNGGPPLPFNPS
jgi:hypothetical protein